MDYRQFAIDTLQKHGTDFLKMEQEVLENLPLEHRAGAAAILRLAWSAVLQKLGDRLIGSHCTEEEAAKLRAIAAELADETTIATRTPRGTA